VGNICEKKKMMLRVSAQNTSLLLLLLLSLSLSYHRFNTCTYSSVFTNLQVWGIGTQAGLVRTFALKTPNTKPI